MVDWFASPHNRSLIEKLGRGGVRLEEEKKEVPSSGPGPLEGLTFVITGTLPNLSREQAGSRIKAAGGKVTNSVSKKTDYVVVGEAAGSKLEKAEKLGIEILDEASLLRRIDGG